MSAETTIGEVVSIERGTTYRSALLGRPGPVLLGLGSIQRNGGFRGDSLRTYGGDTPEKLIVRPGELYASLKDVTQSADLLGAVARLPSDAPVGRLTQDTVRLDVKSGFDRQYLYWVLRTPQYRTYCRAHATGTTNLGLPRDDFFHFRFPVPDRSRLALVRLLEELDDKIESNRRAINLIQEISRLTYVQWRARHPETQATTFGEFADVFGGATPKTAEPKYWEGDIVWATPTDVTALPAPYLFGTARMITEAGLASTSATLHPAGTIFMTSRATIGSFAVAQVPAATNQGFIAVRPRKPEHRWFLFEEMRARVPEMLERANGSTFMELSRGNFKLMPVDVPDDLAIADLDSHLAPLHARAAQFDRESSRLAMLRDTLLPELLSGRIRVPEAREAVAEVAGSV